MGIRRRTTPGRRALAAVSVLLAAACTGDGGQTGGRASARDCDPTRPAAPGRVERTLVFDGERRQYAFSIPDSYDGTSKTPLVVNMHGLGSTNDQQDESSRMPELAGTRGYVVVSPQALPIRLPAGAAFARSAFWNIFGSGKVAFQEPVPADAQDADEVGADDVGFVDALLRTLGEELCLDGDRLYAAGFSNGAGMASTLGCEMGERFAAIGAVGGVNLTGVCPGDAPVSVVAVHGDADSVVLYEGNGLLGLAVGNPSVRDRMTAWAAHNDCRDGPNDAHPLPTVTVTRWTDCRQDTEVTLWSLEGGGHVWPQGDPIDGTRVVLDFFDSHARAAAEAEVSG